MAEPDPASACLAVLRAGDKDRFLATLLAPETAHADLLALHAFATELALVPARVSEAQIGEIRLQWWADTLEAMARGEPQDHPVAQALAATMMRHAIPLAPLSAMVEARRHDLYADQFPDADALEHYLGATESVLIQLACLILSPADAPRAAEASGLAGVAFGLARLLHAPQAQLLPAGMTRPDAVAQARQRQAQARPLVNALPKDLFPAFLCLGLTDMYLQADTPPAQWRRQWRLWRTARRGKIC